MGTELLTFAPPFQFFLDTSFFQELERQKLDVAKLDIKPIPLASKIDINSLTSSQRSSCLMLSKKSYETNRVAYIENTLVKGYLHIFNLITDFKNLKKSQFLLKKSQELWKAGLDNINDALRFEIISYADLKLHKFYYWICVPYFQTRTLAIKCIQNTDYDQILMQKLISWFTKNKQKWVAIIGATNEIDDYEKEALNTGNLRLAIRDTSNISRAPSSNCKSFLSIINEHLGCRTTEVDVYFIRIHGGSFAAQLLLSNEPKTMKGFSIGGWEKNIKGMLGPKMIDLSSLLNPITLADQSVDLNLKLMKWRVAPELDLEVIKNSKTLLLGAGTLGCYVARSLMAWGTRKITFVDSGKVSYSNPVRQPLYEFSDFDKSKAEAAANALKNIFPSIDAEGFEMDIPMIGHSVHSEETVYRNFLMLKDLIESHDVIFLLTDSRESRWLPTVLGTLSDKIIINAALGFDNFLVMRYGRADHQLGRLGCYFCHDVVVPSDSLSDRTLDQMCSVTRPGVAPLASALAVELFVSILQEKRDPNNNDSTPHQIRGFIRNFSMLKIVTPAYEKCSACSEEVVSACRVSGWDFVKQALNNPEYVSTLSGLSHLQDAVNLLDFDENDEPFDDEVYPE